MAFFSKKLRSSGSSKHIVAKAKGLSAGRLVIGVHITVKRLVARLKGRKIKVRVFYCDHFNGSNLAIDAKNLRQGKQFTHTIERDNSSMRHTLLGFKRESIISSRPIDNDPYINLPFLKG